jgi:RNA polymerase sigma factor (TIGR02999 family)
MDATMEWSLPTVAGPQDPVCYAPAVETTAARSSDEMFAAVYDRLKAFAGRRLSRSDRGTLDTTAVVHELYLRMSAKQELRFDDPARFFAYAARALRFLLADRARERVRLRAGGGWARVTMTGEMEQLAIESAEEALGFEEALTRLEESDPRAARIVELVFFAGLTQDQVAALMGLTRRTIGRDWRFARAFLKAELG